MFIKKLLRLIRSKALTKELEEMSSRIAHLDEQARRLASRYEIAMDHQNELLLLLGLKPRHYYTKSSSSMLLDMEQVRQALVEQPKYTELVLWRYAADGAPEHPTGGEVMQGSTLGPWAVHQLTDEVVEYHHRQGNMVEVVRFETNKHRTIL